MSNNDVQSEVHLFRMELAKVWGSKSKCLSRKVGAILITPDGTQVGAGYNGPPRGVPHCDSPERRDWILRFLRDRLGWIENSLKYLYVKTRWGSECPRRLCGFSSGEALHLCPAAHAEANALINAAREGIRTKGLILYVSSTPPCQECFKLIIQAGISKVYLPAGPEYDKQARWLAKNSNVEMIRL